MKKSNFKKLGISLLAVSTLGVVATVTPAIGTLSPVVVHAEEVSGYQLWYYDYTTRINTDSKPGVGPAPDYRGIFHQDFTVPKEGLTVPAPTIPGYRVMEGSPTEDILPYRPEGLGYVGHRSVVRYEPDTGYVTPTDPTTPDSGNANGSVTTPEDLSDNQGDNDATAGSGDNTTTPPADNSNGGDNSTVTPPADNSGGDTNANSGDNQNGGSDSTVTPPADNGNSADTGGADTGEKPKPETPKETPAPAETPKVDNPKADTPKDNGSKPAETPKVAQETKTYVNNDLGVNVTVGGKDAGKSLNLSVTDVDEASLSSASTDLAALDYQAFDIHFEEGGQRYSIESPATVSLPIESGKTVKEVLYLLPTSTGVAQESLPFRVEGGKVSFDVTHFSIYAVVYNQANSTDQSKADSNSGKAETPAPAQKQETVKPKEETAQTAQKAEAKKVADTAALPHTGEQTSMLALIGSVLAGAVALVFGFRRRKN